MTKVSDTFDLPVEHVSDTAWLVAEMRAIESERPDAHFHDRLARTLVGDKGKELMGRFKAAFDSTFLMSVRTQLIDEIILRLVNGGVRTVINLAAGLDTRPYRLSLPAGLHWIEVDFPALIEFKTKKLASETPRCELERIPLDLSKDSERQALLKRLGAEAASAVVLTEGLLGYLTEENAIALAKDLDGQPSFKWWIFDAMDPGVLAWFRQMITEPTANESKTSIRFLPADPVGFFRDFGWEKAELYDFITEGKRLNRFPPENWSAEVIEAFRRSGIALVSHRNASVSA